MGPVLPEQQVGLAVPSRGPCQPGCASCSAQAVCGLQRRCCNDVHFVSPSPWPYLCRGLHPMGVHHLNGLRHPHEAELPDSLHGPWMEQPPMLLPVRGRSARGPLGAVAVGTSSFPPCSGPWADAASSETLSLRQVQLRSWPGPGEMSHRGRRPSHAHAALCGGQGPSAAQAGTVTCLSWAGMPDVKSAFLGGFCSGRERAEGRFADGLGAPG